MKNYSFHLHYCVYIFHQRLSIHKFSISSFNHSPYRTPIKTRHYMIQTTGGEELAFDSNNYCCMFAHFPIFRTHLDALDLIRSINDLT